MFKRAIEFKGTDKEHVGRIFEDGAKELQHNEAQKNICGDILKGSQLTTSKKLNESKLKVMIIDVFVITTIMHVGWVP